MMLIFIHDQEKCRMQKIFLGVCTGKVKPVCRWNLNKTRFAGRYFETLDMYSKFNLTNELFIFLLFPISLNYFWHINTNMKQSLFSGPMLFKNFITLIFFSIFPRSSLFHFLQH